MEPGATLPVAGLLWIVLILSAYISAVMPSLLAPIRWPPLVPDPAWNWTARINLLLTHFKAGAVALWVFLAAFGAGTSIMSFLSRPRSGRIFELAAGLGLAGMTVCGLGFTGLLLAPVLAAALAVAAVYGALGIRDRRWRRPRIPRLSPWEWALAGIALASWLVLLVGCLAPETQADSLNYHLGKAARYAGTGRITAQPSLFYSFPPLWELLLLPAYLLGGETAAHLLNPLMTLATAALLMAGAGASAPKAGAVAAALYLAAFDLNYVAGYCKSDPAVAFFLLAAFLAVVGTSEPSRRPAGRVPDLIRVPIPALTAGIFAGFAMMTKYNAMALAPVLVVPLLLAGRNRRSASSWPVPAGRIAVFALSAGLVVAPWLARNAYETGNPTHPFSTINTSLPPAAAASWRQDLWGYLLGSYNSPLAKVRVLWTQTAVETSLPLLTLILPVLLLLLRRGPALAWSLTALGMTAAWALGPLQARYLLPALPLACGAVAIHLARSRNAPMAAALLTIAIVDSTRLVSSFAFEKPSRLAAAVGATSPEAWRTSRLTTYALATRWAGTRLPAGARFWSHGDQRSYPLSPRTVVTSIIETPRFLSLAAEARDPEHLARKIRQEGVTHLIYNATSAYFRMPRLSALVPGDDALARWGRYFRQQATQVYAPPLVDIREGGFYIYELGTRTGASEAGAGRASLATGGGVSRPTVASTYLPGIEGWLYTPINLMERGRTREAMMAFERLRQTAGYFPCLDLAYVATFEKLIPTPEARAMLKRAEERGLRSISLFSILARLADKSGNASEADIYRARAAGLTGTR